MTTCMNFKNKVVLITGASSGIGAATAIWFSKCGASLILTGRNEEGLDGTIEKCDKSGDRIFKILGDVRDSVFLKRLVDQGVGKFGQLDILINNAGLIEDPSGLENMDLKKYDDTMHINLRAVIELTQMCLPHLFKTKGNIVNVSSIVGTKGSAGGNLAYSVSKAGLNLVTINTAIELASKGVRVNAVNPGVIDTGLQKRIGIDEKEYQEFLEKAKTTHPLGRYGKPEECAKLIAFLASDDASFITGELVHIDGGRHAMVPG